MSQTFRLRPDARAAHTRSEVVDAFLIGRRLSLNADH